VVLETDSLLGKTIGPYLTTALLGAGGMAWVVVASKGGGAPDIALKVLKPKYARDPQFTARFLNEATIAGELRHPNIIRILEAGQDGDAVYFAMPRLSASLAARLEETAVLPEPDVIRAARDVARGMAFAHDAGVVHRDIKPQNILFDGEGQAVLTDFGIARAIASYVSTTGKQLTIGTPHYISPEQARGLPLDGRTDIYALGVTMYRAATGELPFRSSDWYELARLHVEEPPEPPRRKRPELSRAFEKIVLTCMAKDREQRYAHASDLADDLEGVLSGKRSTTDVAIDAVKKMLGR
jgi:eukaryotic-like serine/threonine-protein kinase